jgi:hypothetical protein
MRESSDQARWKASGKCFSKTVIVTKANFATMSLGAKAVCFQEMEKCKAEYGKKEISFPNYEPLYT